MMKLELARCLLRLKPILLVDEITAALDDDNATAIHQLIYAQNVTVLEIAHNFNREVYDEVIVIDNGQLMVS